jgi:uncharacterized protein (DUF2336 family)
VTRKPDSNTPATADYDAAKRMARSEDPAVRKQVAQHPGTRPELLYFLATDTETTVRRAIATNTGTPRQADLLLAKDTDLTVRQSVARKVSRLVPELQASQLSQIERMTVECLEMLARDQVTEIRAILAEELKDLPNAPHAVINRLARDVQLQVCGPVLADSPVLTEEDLLDIIMSGPVAGALSAIAGRKGMSASVADAIARSDDEAAITALLANTSTQIREETLDRLVDHAPQHEPWHAPLVRRPKLPPGAAVRLAAFVADNLLKALQERGDLDPASARQIAETVQARLAKVADGRPRGLVDFGDEAPASAVGGAAAAPNANEAPAEKPADRAKRLNKEGKLTEKVLEGSMAEGDRAFVLAAFCELGQITSATVDRIMSTHSPRAVASLIWLCGLSMRFAKQVQLRLAQIPPKSVLNPRDGVDFPMGEDEMRWQLEFFGIEKKK